MTAPNDTGVLGRDARGSRAQLDVTPDPQLIRATADRDGTLVIEAATVLGLAAGDEVALVDASGGAAIGRARVRVVAEGTATLRTMNRDSSLPTGFQVCPPSVVRKTPAPAVAA